MKNLFKTIIAAVALICCAATPSPLAAAQKSSDIDLSAHPDWLGVWGAWGTESQSASWLKGSFISFDWAQIEAKEGVFDFSKLDMRIKRAVANGQHFMLKLYIVNHPSWIPEKGVIMIPIDFKPEWSRLAKKHSQMACLQDPKYQYYIYRVWDELQKYAKSLPSELKSKFVGFQVPLGRSGDMHAYYEIPYGKLAKGYEQYSLPYEGEGSEKWAELQIEMASKFNEMLAEKDMLNPEMYPLYNFTMPGLRLALERGLKFNQKSPMVAQRYHMSGETVVYDNNFQMGEVNKLRPDGTGYFRCRGEFDDLIRDDSPWFLAAPIWHYYWNSQWMLTYGMDIFVQRTKTVDRGDENKVAFDYFNEHAGYKHIPTAKYAHVALRDDLDIRDTDRFPESEYGGFDNKFMLNKRFEKILAEMAPFGARNDDPENQIITGPGVYRNKLRALNDAAQNVWRGNYGRYLDQIEPNKYDQGYWRVGSMQEPYGRFARGFDLANGKNALYFDLNDQFYGEGNKDAKSVKVTIIYFDGGKGSWSLNYNSVGGSDKEAFTIKNKNTNKWKSKSIKLTDALFDNGAEMGSDIYIKSAKGNKENCIFHLVEIER